MKYFLKSAIIILLVLISFNESSFCQNKFVLPKNGEFKDSILAFSDTIEIVRLQRDFIKDPPFLVFKGKIHMENSLLISGIHTDFTTFEKPIQLIGVKLNEGTNFYGSKYLDFVSYYNTHFNGLAGFFGNHFKSNASFHMCYFNGVALFSGTTFEKKADFTKAMFKQYADFSNTDFNGSIIFDDADLPNVLNFINSNFENLDLRYTNTFSINRNKNKVEQHYWDKESFANKGGITAIKQGFLRFENDSSIYFQSKNSGKCAIQLLGSTIENIILPYDKFIVDTSYYSYEAKTNLYDQLIRNCSNVGMTESVKGWSIELKKIQNRHDFNYFGGFLNWFQKWFWNFGYSKWFIIFWLAGVYLFFTFVNCIPFVFENLLSVYYYPELGQKLTVTEIASEEYLIRLMKIDKKLRIRYMLHYTGIVFFGLKLEHTRLSFKNLKWVFLFYFEFLLGITLLGFTVNFVLNN